MNLIQLIYVSKAVRRLDEDALARILDASVRHNTANQITGMLLYAEQSFMQVLEGEESAVQETMSRIMQDTRHHCVHVVLMDKIERREFSQWSMGIHRIDSVDAKTWPLYASFFKRGFNAEMIDDEPGVALEILNIFATKGHSIEL